MKPFPFQRSLVCAVVTTGLVFAGAVTAGAAEREDRCARLAAIADSASSLREEGVSKDEALSRLAASDAADAKAVRGVVLWSYMARMKSPQAGAYYKKQCLQN